MQIPKFDKVGNLPVGDLFNKGGNQALIRTDLGEMRDHFVARFPLSKSRPGIWEGWMRHRNEMDGLGITYSTLIGGSFLTTKGEPRDIDFCMIFDGAEVNRLESTDPKKFRELARLSNTLETKKSYSCDAYSLRVYPVDNPRFFLVAYYWNYWTRVFGIDRKGRQRAVLFISGGGVL